ncbi:hypothetical protein J4573_01420 [Actinomadura barringtoniae]|uniref:Uncharacterized protein n=1 Tax=Actinomadura barringtoniae TaxID=1427535 RepID=A0A939PC35_9ACTN|nr:hypothetical protein [Actinomadura barringtoniae]MBO2445741.1 hypothetical protein [Actinomadura barringtoniae]
MQSGQWIGNRPDDLAGSSSAGGVAVVGGIEGDVRADGTPGVGGAARADIDSGFSDKTY